jgi:hypothetical protein
MQTLRLLLNNIAPLLQTENLPVHQEKENNPQGVLNPRLLIWPYRHQYESVPCAKVQ